MILKIILTVSGENLFPDTLLQEIEGKFIVAGKNNPTDRKHEDKIDTYEFGSISFFHPKKFTTQTNILDYEEWYINFIITNYELFINQGVKDFEFFIEIYHDSDQCNFEIFNKNLLKSIMHINLSLPISIYNLKEKELQQWVNEIETEWQSS